jgi:hypothetical protein
MMAWSLAGRRREPPGGIVPADPQDLDATSAERRAGCLALLRAYTRMIKILQQRVDVTVNAALAQGASYGQVASACGVSRQAARQRWLRRNKEQDGQPAGELADRPPARGWDPAQAGPTTAYVSPIRGGLGSAAAPMERSRGGSAGR